MAYKPLMSGESTVEISAKEYFELAKAVERIAAVERFVNGNNYVTTNEVLALLDIEKRNNEVNEE